MKIYYQTQKTNGIIKKRKRNNSKSDLVKTDAEKNKFLEWLSSHLEYKKDSVICWAEFIENYIKNTSPIIKSVYKEYFEEYVSLHFPELDSNYKCIRINKELTVRGWKHIVFKL